VVVGSVPGPTTSIYNAGVVKIYNCKLKSCRIGTGVQFCSPLQENGELAVGDVVEYRPVVGAQQDVGAAL
jgi:hypothetical protein